MEFVATGSFFRSFQEFEEADRTEICVLLGNLLRSREDVLPGFWNLLGDGAKDILGPEHQRFLISFTLDYFKEVEVGICDFKAVFS